MNKTFTLLTVMTLSLATVSAGVIDIGSRRELFVDRHMVGEITGDARLQQHRPEPQEVVLVTGEPWEGNTSAYYTIFQDGDLYRMYYRGSNWDVAAKKATHPEVTCYAESRDGINWTKPNLGIVEYEGSKQNNIILDGIGTHCFVAFKDGNPDAPPEARYKGISRGRPLGKKGLYVYQSPDGIHWKMIRNEPVITEGAFDSQNLAFWDPQIGKYREFHRIFVNRVRAIMTGTSDDFVNWTDPVLLKYPGAPNQHLYTNAIRAYHRAPHILIGFPTRYLPDEGQRVEPIFMASRDGLTFHRWNDPVIPEDAPKDRAGNRSNYMTWGLLELPGRPGEMSVYASEAYYEGPDTRLRRFTYRADGFVSASGGPGGGDLVTQPLKFSGSRLEVNFRARPGGQLRVELQDQEGRPIPGYTLVDCPPLTGDSTRILVNWKQCPCSQTETPNEEETIQPDVGSLAGQTIRVRFRLENADLYSFRFSD